MDNKEINHNILFEKCSKDVYNMLSIGTLIDVINEAAFHSKAMNELSGRRQSTRLYKPLPKKASFDSMSPADVKYGTSNQNKY